MSENRVDDLIVADMNRQSGVQPAAPAEPVPPPEAISKDITKEEVSLVVKDVPHGTSESTENTQSQPEIAQKEENKPEIEVTATNSNIDEYGNPIAPPKTYTEEEVNRMIRDRLSRGRNVEPQVQQQVHKAAEDFKADPNSEESWETQLEAFVEKTIEKRQAKQSEAQWKQQEAAKQADFESRFSSGMGKYQDFHAVVAGKPVTDSMMLATRTLENPAAFIYGAAKLHPQELERISRIADPYAQAAEVGRLHERMVKIRNMSSNAPKPLEVIKGDVTAKKLDERPSIDYLIQQHAKQKQARK